jgi:integrase
VASIAKRPDGQWRARYRDAAGKEHSRHFARKTDAQRWLNEVTASVVTGMYVDPRAGNVTFAAYAEHWRSIQQHRPATAELVERIMRIRVYPRIGNLPLNKVLRSDVQAMVSGWKVSPATAQVTYRFVSSIFKAAVHDRKIAASPCIQIKLPEIVEEKVTPLSTATVHAIVEALPGRYQALAFVAAGTGLRQGEVFGLTTDRVIFLERRLKVDRQLVGLSGHAPTFGPPKTKASNREIPLPTVVADAMAAHIAAYPPGDDGLIFTGSAGQPLRRSAFGEVWRTAVAQAGSPGVVFHSLRHYYASLLIRHGESVKTVQDRLGHGSADETLRTYAHMWPDADDRTRAAVDLVLGAPADSLRTEVEGVMPS